MSSSPSARTLVTLSLGRADPDPFSWIGRWLLSITAISDADYYLGATPGSGCCASVADYELDAIKNGEPPGRWAFRGENVLNLHGEITAEGPSADAFRLLINELRDPNTGERLGRPPSHFRTPDERAAAWAKRNPHATPEQVEEYRVRAATDQRQAVNAWDLTFSAPKSWSVLHAAYQWDGRHEEAAELWAAIEAGIEAALTQAFDEVGFTRQGPAGPKVAGRATTEFHRVKNFVMGVFRHHLSRDGDPQLHAHVSLVNRVLCADGAWRSLYSPALLKNKHLLDATFLRVAEAEATRRLGLSFVARPDGVAREIEGVSPEIREFFSSRTRALTEEAEEKLQAWQTANGCRREDVPARIRWQIYKDATLSTREAKPGPVDRGEELRRWEREAREQTRESFRFVLDEVDATVDMAEPIVVERVDRQRVIKQALADLETTKSTFSRSHLVHALSQRLPDMLAVEPADTQAFLAGLADEAIASGEVVSGAATPAVETPPSLRDAKTGRSRFEVAHEQRYTTRKTLAREDSLVARLDHHTSQHVPAGTVTALLAGSGLSDEQAAVVRRVASSGRALEVVDAGAGTGKSRMVRSLSQVWEQAHGVGIVGFALSQNAADVLKGEGIERTFNIPRFLHYAERAERGEVTDMERARFAVPADSVAVIDESSMLDTPKATELLRRLDELAVAKVVLVGDTEQVDAVDAGGGFAMLVQELEQRERVAEAARRVEQRALPPSQQHLHDPLVAAWTGQGEREKEPAGRVHRLTEVRRFTNPWERDASTRLRNGEPEALAQYEARGRVSGDHDLNRVRSQAVAAFITDHLSGRDSIIITATSDEADVVASHVREQLARAGHVEHDGALLRGINKAGVGDLVQTRLNDPQLGVTNRQVWQVVGRTERGDLDVRAVLGRDEHGEQVWGEPIGLPSWYVNTQVDLAYASTVEAVQGRTLDTSHTLVDRMMGRSRAYPAMTRGRDANHAHVHLEDKETPVGRLAAVFADDDHTQAARVHIAEEDERATHLGHLGPQWESVARETRACAHRDMLQRTLRADADAVLADPASNRLFSLLRAAELRRHDPGELVTAAMQRGSLSGARSPASVLYARLDEQMKVGPLVAPTPTSYEQRVPAPSRGDVDNERLRFARELGKAMDARAARLADQVAEEEPEWAVRALGRVPRDPVARQKWVEDVAHAAAYREQYGFTHPFEAIGQRPTHLEPERCWLWDTAARQIGMPEHERDLAAQPEVELANRVQEWERTEAWLPRWVDHDLRTAHLARQQLERQIVEARTAGTPHAEVYGELHRQNLRIARLEEIAEHRSRAVAATEGVRQRAEDAQRELDRRAELDRARAGVPLPREPEDDQPEPESEEEREEREAREVEDREAAAHAAVFGLLSAHRQPDVPEYGSTTWWALEPDDPRREAAVVQAAVAWWNVGEGRDQEVAELQARLESAAEVIGVPATSPEIDEDTLAVLAWQDPHLRGDAPQFGSPEWAELEEDDPRREAATVRAAASYWRLGDTPERLRERVEAAEDRASSIEISRDLERRRDEAHRQRVERERAERVAEDNRERRAWLRPVEVSPQEMAVDGLAAAELDYRDLNMSETEREVARLYLESQGVQPEPEASEPSDEPVVWPEPAPIPEPEPEADDQRNGPSEIPEGPSGSGDEPERGYGGIVASEPIPVEEPGAGPEPRPEEPKPHPGAPADADPEPDDEPYLEPEPEDDEPEPEPEPDEERFQAGLEWSLEQAARQREADERAEVERAERETAQRDEPEPDPEPRDEEADRDAQIEADLAHAREAAARLEAQREADERAADEAARWEPEPEPEPEVELVD